MFGIATWLVRNKLVLAGGIALIAYGVNSTREAEAERPTSPWAIQPEGAATTASSETGVVEDLMAEAGDLVSTVTEEATGASDETVGRFDNAASSFSAANSR